jgi:hypothetical protein
MNSRRTDEGLLLPIVAGGWTVGRSYATRPSRAATRSASAGSRGRASPVIANAGPGAAHGDGQIPVHVPRKQVMTTPPRRVPDERQRSDALVFFGATGDLAYKQVFRALQGLVEQGRLDIRVLDVAAPFALAAASAVRLADRAGTSHPRRVPRHLRLAACQRRAGLRHGVIVNRKTIRKLMRAQACTACQEPERPSGARPTSRPPLTWSSAVWTGRYQTSCGSPISPRTHPGGQGVLLRGTGGVPASGGGLVHRQPPGHPAGPQCAGHGHHQPQPPTGSDGHPQQSRLAAQVQGVDATPLVCSEDR